MYYTNIYSNLKYFENICMRLSVSQQSKNRKLKNDNCWQRTSLRYQISQTRKFCCFRCCLFVLVTLYLSYVRLGLDVSHAGPSISLYRTFEPFKTPVSSRLWPDIFALKKQADSKMKYGYSTPERQEKTSIHELRF